MSNIIKFNSKEVIKEYFDSEDEVFVTILSLSKIKMKVITIASPRDYKHHVNIISLIKQTENCFIKTNEHNFTLNLN